MERALYGPHGFYRTRGGPAAHFRTSVHASPLFATAVVRLLREIDETLDRPGEIALVDVGAGRGELLELVHSLLDQPLTDDQRTSDPKIDSDQPPADPLTREPLTYEPPAREPLTREPLAKRVRLIAVELADRPDNLTSDIEWRSELPDSSTVTGLLIANEWLDNVPCDVVQATVNGWRGVEVTMDGTERLGLAPTPDQQAWLDAWWPADESTDAGTATAAGTNADLGTDVHAGAHADPGTTASRAEIGLARDAAWQQAVGTLARGVAVAIDYVHTRTSRPPFGTLTGYAQGRQTAPVPDGSCDITAHVALDACAAAAALRADWTVHSDQRTVLHSLGITGTRPALSLASSDPRGYLRALSQASAATELTDTHGLGGFGWLAQGVSVPVPPSLAALTRSDQT